MNYGCKGLAVVITGGTSGIGRACAECLLAEGAEVFVLARHAQHVEAVDGAGATVQARFIACDVRNADSVAAAVAELKKQAGRVDILINSAGIYREQRLESVTEADYQEMMDTNVKGTVFMCRGILPLLNYGCIVNVASDAGIRGNYGCALYSASKGAVVAFTKSLALDLAPQVRVNCVCPGDVDTPMMTEQCRIGHYTVEECGAVYPLGRIARVEEVAHVICSVASPANSFMTGAVVSVDGGLS